MNPLADQNHDFWRNLNLKTSQYVDYLTGSYDILARVIPDTRPEAERKESPLVPAWFKPVKREIFIDATTAFNDVHENFGTSKIDPTSMTDRKKFPMFIAMLAHEVGHEKFTRYAFSTIVNGKEVTSMERSIVELLEESRMEYHMKNAFPDPGCYLAYTPFNIIYQPLLHKKIKARFGKNDALSAILLLMSRAELGITSSAMFDDLKDAVAKHYSNYEVMKGFFTLLKKVNHDDYLAMVEIARAIIAVLGLEENEELPDECQSHATSESDMSATQLDDNNKDNSDPQESSSGQSQEGTNSDSSEDDNSSEGNTSDFPTDAKDQIEGNESKENQNTQEMPKMTELQKKKFDHMVEQSKRDIESEVRKAQDNFSYKETDEVHENEIRNHQRNNAYQNPTILPVSIYRYDEISAQDKQNARILSYEIKRAQFRDYDTKVRPVNIPHGRINMREAMRLDVQNKMNLERTAKPWNIRNYREVENPPLNFGIATDTSGSMSPYVKSVMHYLWSLQEAILHNQGNILNMAWDGAIYEVEHKKKHVLIPKQGNFSSALPYAVSAITKKMDFYKHGGAKILSVVTDGRIPNNHTEKLINDFRILKASGVKILWISTTSIDRELYEKYASFIQVEDPSDFSKIITPRIVEALRNS